jgi:protocatechuate 3,4-dioxygenase alpha subunit
VPAIPTPSQTVGPFYHYALDRPAWADLTADGASGEKIHIEGRILDGDRVPVFDAFLEIWQANEAGKYAHPEDSQDKPLDVRFRGFGRVGTDAEGRFRFTTIRPGRVAGRGNTLQAPHINIAIFGRGLLKQLTTRLYFADQKEANESDPVLSAIDDPAARKTLLAEKVAAPAGAIPTYRFDIILQGDGETVFFEI